MKKLKLMQVKFSLFSFRQSVGAFKTNNKYDNVLQVNNFQKVAFLPFYHRICCVEKYFNISEYNPFLSAPSVQFLKKRYVVRARRNKT